MTEVKVLPVVEHDLDRWGLPARLTVPVRLTRPIPVMADGKRIGEVATDGMVEWVGPNSAANFQKYGQLVDVLDQAAKGSGRFLVAIVDGTPSSVVVPSERTRRDKRI